MSCGSSGKHGKSRFLPGSCRSQKEEEMSDIKMFCTKDMLINIPDVGVTAFDAWENYEALNRFFGTIDPGYMCPKEEYFDGFDQSTWEDYVIYEDGKIAARAAIWMYSDEAWEVAGVHTLPSYRRRGYGKALVGFCTAEILRRGRRATCTTGEDNIAMLTTAKAVGFQQI